MSRLPMWVDCTLFPSGSVRLRGSCVSLLSTIGASVTRKFPVAPESNTAHLLMSATLKSIVAKRLLAACPYVGVPYWWNLECFPGDVGDGTDFSGAEVLDVDVGLTVDLGVWLSTIG